MKITTEYFGQNYNLSTIMIMNNYEQFWSEFTNIPRTFFLCVRGVLHTVHGAVFAS